MSSDASKAALLANNYKMETQWKPEASAAGSKAALLAHHGQGRDWWQPTASKDGLQAATLAAKNKTLTPQLDYGYTDDGKSKALLAARLSVKGRKRAESTPAPAARMDGTQQSNSLKAATLAHADGLSSKAIEQSRITHARNLSRDMYTEHPNVEIEKKEKAHQDALRSASISMAKQIYAIEKVDDSGHVRLNAGQVAARKADRASVETTKDLRQQALEYLTLQDAAQRLAAERLAKIEDRHESAAFRDYYGYPSKRKSLLSFKGRNRRRTFSDGAISFKQDEPEIQSEPTSPQPHRRGNLDIDSDDEEQAARVRSQMNAFNAKLAAADKKRLRDREALIAAAERKVQEQMSKMDEKVFNETGKMSPAMMAEWDNRARQKAVAASRLRMENHGKVDVGGGKFLDQSEIDAIALANIKPTLDEINETAQKQRARDEEIRLEKEEQRRQMLKEKERNAETKALQKKIKAEERDAEREKRRNEKIAAAHEKTAAKEERQREKEAAKEEKQRSKETAAIQKSAAMETSQLQRHKESDDFQTPKKSPWKKLISHRHEREPGRISKIMATDHPEGGKDEVSAKPSAVQPEPNPAPVAEGTLTGATMAGDTPATVAAPAALPETEAVIDHPVTTSTEEHHAAIGPTSSRSTAPRESEEVHSASSPTKKRFTRILGKFKRNKKDKDDDDDAATETSSFSGGVKLHKKRSNKEAPHPAREADKATPALGSGAIVRKPSISSMSSSSSDEEALRDSHDEERGRSATPKDVTKSAGEAGDSEDTDGDWEEARDRFDGDLAPPARILSKKHGNSESPVRDSKFHEDI
ncbi:hypothetical protein, variant [Verruconis gallopava]|nr:hypothetical protein, variant [Verruconis gallopava]KIW01422.1 hypothetical protein, variant [Verruconis gallopava]